MALVNCSQCAGTGATETGRTCHCVARKIFRECLARFRYCAAGAGAEFAAPVSLEPHTGPRRTNWGMKQSEYVADFWLVSKRSLDPCEWKIFSYHYLLGADWKLCCRKLKTDRGNFFHACFRIEQKLGRVFAELKPYPLYPLDEYFQGTVRGAKVASIPVEEDLPRQHAPVAPPLAVA